MSLQFHKFHLVSQSPWPLYASASVLTLALGLVLSMHGFAGGFKTLIFGFIITVFFATLWWRDVIRESTFEGCHTRKVQQGLRLGFILFIVSETMLFVSLFWAFFHSSLAPGIEIGGVWPPNGVVTLNTWGIPLLNTYILLLSGATLTYAHYSLVLGDLIKTINSLLVTLFLALFFLLLQAYEYKTAPFDISDSVYGSTFYLLTGFHGLHVLVGFLFLLVCFYRLSSRHFTKEHHLGFEAAAWYWHFVDVIWLLVFILVYYYSN